MGSKTSRMAEKGKAASIQEKVEYRVFPVIPDGISSKELHDYLEEQLDACLAQLSRHLVDYIWQNQGFTLRVIPNKGMLTLC